MRLLALLPLLLMGHSARARLAALVATFAVRVLGGRR